MKITKGLVMLLFLIMAVLFGCSKRESAKRKIPGTPDGASASWEETVIAAEWYQAGTQAQNAKRVKLRGNALLSASWIYDTDAECCRNLKVVMERPNEGKRELFSGEGMKWFEFFTGADDGVFYLYENKEGIFLQKDIVDAEGNVTEQYRKNIEDMDVFKNEDGRIRIAEGKGDGAGRLTLRLQEGKLIHFDGEGNLSFVTDTAAIDAAGSADEGILVIGKDGYYYNVSAGQLILWHVDYEAEKLVDREYVSYEDKGDYHGVYSGYGQGFYIVTDEGLQHYSEDKSYDREIVSWKNGGNGIMAGGIRGLGIMEDGNICLYYKDGQEAGTVELKAVAKEDYAERQRIVLAGIFNNDIRTIVDGNGNPHTFPTGFEEVAEYVEKFNRYSRDYYIEMVNYDVHTESNSFYMDLIKGKGADIFILNNMPVESLASKGILEDLTPYFEASEVVNKDDIEEAVWRAGAVGKGEYAVFPCFYVRGYLAAPQLADENGSMTPDALFSALEEYPDSTVSNYESTPAFLFINEFSMEARNYLDMESGTCSFDSEAFIQLLEKTKAYADQERKFTGQADENGTAGEWLSSHKCLLYAVSGMPFQYLDMKELFSASCILAGYPDSSGQPCYRFMKDWSYGINSASGCKEGAWAFLEFLLSKELQEGDILNNDDRYSARKDVNEMLFAQVLDGSHERFTYTTHWNNYTGQAQEEYGVFTEEDKAVLRYIIDHAYMGDSMWFHEIQEVLIEELDAYFAGDKSAEETAKNLQGRVELYLGEME